ncbi:alpha-amylase family protein [Azohydromonas caseinilytica]|uniref:Trehalose synthase n=1 Tax=Azohydromonas caseinilytica TaxID=2728836 RepID=A0A848FEJ4_9BURK|nr:alpha-amylase family protein [Azohydromonas caseinilytica]NML16570.1 trehalose synthase [Azohydromonas caseinilytica]
MAEPWYQSAIVYCLDVRTFADGNGDGIGDFAGLAQHLEHLAGLNISCVWLQPFFPSPLRDNGYDITDYYAVDPALGTLGDFVEFMRRARERGIRVVIDLVVNHTSTDHAWFQAARADRNSPLRDWYVWSDAKPEDAEEGTVFPGSQQTTWTWDEKAQAYYFHRFYDHQAELNIAHPAVRREIEKITGFWLELGVSGFRVDALPFLLELQGLPREGQRIAFGYLRELRQHVQTLRGDVCLMAEANITPEEVPSYFGDGDQIHMSFSFWLNQHLFLALARGDARPLRQAWEELPALPSWCRWAHFLRSHDELDLGRLSEAERQEVFRAFGPEPEMQLYGRGLRRRLAPMLGNDARRLALAHSLLLTLPGTPVLRYGDEIGMGEDLSLKERASVRTPMQWSRAPNGGFSSAPAERLRLPVISGGEFGYEEVNVDAQRADPESLLNRLERMLRLRRQCPAFGLGSCCFLDLGTPPLLAMRCEYEGKTYFALHNLGEHPLELALPPEASCAGLYDLLAGQPLETHCDGSCWLALEPYGYRWLRAG